MKKIMFVMTMVLMSITMSASAATTSSNKGIDLEKIVIEQTVTFEDGTTAVLYYKVEDGCVAMYSEQDASKYSLNDLMNVKSSSERKVSAVKGKRYAKYSFVAIRKMITRWLKA